MRPNQLTGYGIVVGLAGTGDDNLEYATQGMNGVASRFGLTLPPGVNPALKNAAAVMITAELPAFARPGQRLDITVSAMGRARSLRGGTLIMSPLRGADNQIYAMAQGNLAVGGLGVSAQDGSQVSVNVPSSGRIPGGATVERAVETGFATTPGLVFNLAESDFTTAQRIADAINREVGQPIARAEDGVSVAVAGAAGRGDPRRADEPDREYRGRARRCAGPGHRQCAHRHGGDQRRGAHPPRRGQPWPAHRLGAGRPAGQPAAPAVRRPDRGRAQFDDRDHRASLAHVQLRPGASLSEIVRAVNAIGAAPSDLVAILEALKQAGALRAELIIL